MTRSLLRSLACAIAGPILAPALLGAQDRVVIGFPEAAVDAVPGIAVVGEAYRRIGVEVEWRGFPGASSIQAANAGETDAELQRIEMLPAGFENLVRVDAPVSLLQGAVLTRDPNLAVTQWLDLRDVHVGVLRGVLFIEESLLAGPVTYVDTYDDLYGLLRDQTVEAIVIPRLDARQALTRLGPDARLLAATLQTNLLYHYVHRRNVALVPRLERVLKDMLVSGETRALIEGALAGMPGDSSR